MMSYPGLKCVVEILKIARPTIQIAGITPVVIIRNISTNTAKNELQIASLILGNIQRAYFEIEGTPLPTDITSPVSQVVKLLMNGFRLDYLTQPIDISDEMLGLYVGYITMVLNASNSQLVLPGKSEAAGLAAEIESFSESVDFSKIDPAVADLLRKKMAALATLLRHIPIFGIDAALETYWSIVFSAHRGKAEEAVAPAPQSSSEPAKSLSVKLGEWLTRITQLDQAIAAGTKLLGHAGDAAKLLEHLPFP